MSTCNILMFTCDIYVNMQHNYVDTHVFVFLNLGQRLTLNWGQISAPFPKTKSDVFSPLYFQKFPICFYILILKSFFKSNSKMKTFQERELIFQDQNLFQVLFKRKNKLGTILTIFWSLHTFCQTANWCMAHILIIKLSLTMTEWRHLTPLCRSSLHLLAHLSWSPDIRPSVCL